MPFVDYYKILAVPKTATDKQIKAAYRKLARKYHPDLNQDDKAAEAKFKAINEANEVLSNPESRKKYDTYGQDWEHGAEKAKYQQEQRQSQRQTSQQGYTEGNYSEFFESMFGGSRGGYSQGSAPKYRGQDYNAELTLSLTDVYTTLPQVLTVNGKKIKLTVPAGIENGQVIKIKGQGGPGVNGGLNGDLYIKFDIANDTAFKRVGDHLYQSIDLDLYTAILGGELTVGTFDGKVKLQVKPETPNQTKVKLKGKGFPKYKKEGLFGDLIITYMIKLPTDLSSKEIELYKELQNLRKP